MIDHDHTEQKYTELSTALAINKHDLDTVCVEHAELMAHVGDLEAAWAARRDQLKLALQRLEAKLDAQIRHDAALSKEKITEKEISRQMDLEPEVMGLQDQVAAASAWVTRLSKLWESYKDRRHMIGKLGDLYTSNYYGEPSAGKFTSEAKERLALKARKELAGQRRDMIAQQNKRTRLNR